MKSFVLTSWMTSCLIITGNVSGQVQFTASPSDVTPPMTDSLEVRCSLNDIHPLSSSATTTSTTTSSAVLVGRSVVAGRRGAGHTGHVEGEGGGGKQADTSPDITWGVLATGGTPVDPIKHLISISISRSGKPIATVSTHTAAMLEDDLDKGHVAGRVDITSAGQQGSGELGYLNITWSHPTDAQAGQYGCSVSGISTSGHILTLTRTLHVATSPVTVSDLAVQILQLKKDKTAQQQHNAMQQATIEDLQSKMADQRLEISRLQNETLESKHVETGFLSCGHSGGWHSGSSGARHEMYTQKQMTATFSKDYSRTPVVFLATSFLYVYAPETHHWGTHLVTVSNHGFSMRCGTHPNDKVGGLEVRWIAIPA